MISMRLPLSSINDGFKALEEGKVARAIIEFWLENTYEKNYLSKRGYRDYTELFKRIKENF